MHFVFRFHSTLVLLCSFIFLTANHYLQLYLVYKIVQIHRKLKAEFKDNFQSVLRSLRVCFHVCFEFVDMLHFGNGVHEVFEPSLRVVTLNAR